MPRFHKNIICTSQKYPDSPEIRAASAPAIVPYVEFIRTANYRQFASKLEVAPETVRPRALRSLFPAHNTRLGETRETISDHCSCRPLLLTESCGLSAGNMEGWSGQSQHYTTTAHVDVGIRIAK